MPKTYDANFATEPPADLPLSTRVKGLRKAWQEAETKLSDYQRENARYARHKTLNSFFEAEYYVPALQDAEKEAREQELTAVAAGKALPDRDAILGPVKAKVDEYARTVPALRTLAEKAKQEYSEALRNELVSMGLKEAQKAAKAREDWEKAYKAAMEAKATLERHADLFSFCVTAGGMDVHPRRGHSQGDKLEYWELNKDGLLTFEASQELDYDQIPVEVPGLIEPNPSPPVTEEFNHNPKPRHFLASPDGYGDDWEH